MRRPSASSAPQKAPAVRKVAASSIEGAYDHQSVESRLSKEWEKSGFFNPDKLPGKKRAKPFTIMMPPPNATGTLHTGHASMLALQDAMIRYHRMKGDAALWLPGTDHAALATNAKVEKILAKEGKTKEDLGREGFVERVKAFIADSQDTIRNQVRAMGSSCDWSREAYTFDEPRSAAVREIFARMYNDGLIYRGTRIVNWCPHCESALADDEVQYKEEKASLYFMKYGPFVVATTRPETKLGDTAVAVHPDDARYKKWIGKTFMVDFGIGDQEIRVIADKGIDPDFGSGVLGVTPAHSMVDYAMAEKNKLPVKKVIGEDGRMTSLAGQYAGMPVAEARETFVAELRRRGLIEKVEEITHNLSVCDRCSTPIEPLTSLQWFVDVNKKIPGRGKTLKQLSIEAVKSGKTSIIPERFEKVYFNWMNGLHDWCISRQIWFGHRIPVWYCADCQAKGKDDVIVASTAPKKCPSCKGANLTQDPDVLDTWFSSGTWTFSTLGWPKQTSDLKRFHPTSVLETGYDILFFWIARMILMTTYAMKEVPFRYAYLHGLVRDEQGRKMSKSLGNIIDPLDVIEKYGTDALRLALVVGNTPGNDLRLSDEKIAHFRNFANKLWNLARFVQMQLGGKKIAAGAKPTPKSAADKYILARLDEVVREVTADLESLNMFRPGEVLRDFTWGEFADWYVEIAKIEKGKEKILAYVLHTLLRLWHPLMPFVTEEIWRLAVAKGPKDFLMVAAWPKAGPKKSAGKIAEEFGRLQSIITSIRNIRATYKVEPGRQIDAALAAGRHAAFVKKNAEVIKGMARVAHLEVAAKRQGGAAAKDAATATAAGVTVTVPLSGLVDLAAERSRLDRDIAETAAYVKVQEAKLANKDFVSRAPAQVVAAEKEKLAQAREKAGQLAEQRKALGE